jgi:hypothetical protein
LVVIRNSLRVMLLHANKLVISTLTFKLHFNQSTIQLVSGLGNYPR